MTEFYKTTVSDIVLCQRCPALLAYKLYLGKKNAWKVGIKGKGEAYGSIFHKNIAQVFFEAAANPKHKLHSKIKKAVSGNSFQLEKMISENIFMPFIEKNSENFSSGQILSMADGVKVWVNAMYNFFRSIPSLVNNPEKNMLTVFIEPEKVLAGNYKLDNGVLLITGRYDALMFNPDKAEARLFEFKGFKKSDVIVPLSQSLIYSWLIEKASGIVPSIEIIYLDEDKNSSYIFDSDTVKSMIKTGLPGLFYSVVDIISLRRLPEILRNKKLCEQCNFKCNCEKDINRIFTKKRRGSSLISVLIFFIAAVLMTAQAFFYSTNSNESLAEDRELMGIKLRLSQMVEEARNNLSTKAIGNVNYKNFYTETAIKTPQPADELKREEIPEGKFYQNTHYLKYTFQDATPGSDWGKYSGDYMYKKIFPAMGENCYLIRAFTKIPKTERFLMYQVFIDDGKIKSYEEIWF